MRMYWLSRYVNNRGTFQSTELHMGLPTEEDHFDRAVFRKWSLYPIHKLHCWLSGLGRALILHWLLCACDSIFSHFAPARLLGQVSPAYSSTVRSASMTVLYSKFIGPYPRLN